MIKHTVGLVRYETPLESVRRVVDLAGGLAHLPSSSKVFIKPNIVFWTRTVNFPKWGVITTSRVIEDMVILLKERGVDDITIGEGMVLYDPKDKETPPHAFDSLGYNALNKRYGVKCMNVHERPFETVDLGDGIELKFNADILQSDFVVNVPVLKTHAQTKVSLGIKNIKGMLSITSRRKCHSADPERDLHLHVSRLADKLPPAFTLLDGIYTLERGPGFDGKPRRSNILAGSHDMLSADMVGTLLLGLSPSDIPYLVHAAANHSRPTDLSDVEVRGEKVEDLAAPHQYAFQYNESGTLPIQMERMGIQGVQYPKYDSTICTYCSVITGPILASIAYAWKGRPWNDVEVLTGKIMKPTPGKKTILLGRCLYQANKNHPNIDDMIAIKSCPPSPDAVIKALHEAGIDVNPTMLQNLDKVPAFLMQRYEGKPEFDESFFKIE